MPGPVTPGKLRSRVLCGTWDQAWAEWDTLVKDRRPEWRAVCWCRENQGASHRSHAHRAQLRFAAPQRDGVPGERGQGRGHVGPSRVRELQECMYMWSPHVSCMAQVPVTKRVPALLCALILRGRASG